LERLCFARTVSLCPSTYPVDNPTFSRRFP
jgi:hypothetical protein